jgi:tellurite resistance protein
MTSLPLDESFYSVFNYPLTAARTPPTALPARACRPPCCGMDPGKTGDTATSGGRVSGPQTGEKDRSPKRRRFLGPRVPPTLFGIALGIAGLEEAWRAAVPLLGTPQAIADALSILDAALWAVLVGAYLAQSPRIVLADLRDPVLSPFVSASALTAMILSAALAKDAFTAGRVLVIVFLAVTIGLGGWLTGQWMTGGIEPDSVHPGYFLPTAAGGLIGANAAAQVHLHALAEASFGIGIISWLLLGSAILNRLFSRPALPPALVPTMAIELGIPAVAGSAYFAVAAQTVSLAACVIGGYAVLMVLVQLRLIPVYRRLSFTPGAWSFTFAYAAAAAYALSWLTITRPPGTTGYAIAVLVLLTAFISWIAFRTVVLAVRGQLFPAWPPIHQTADTAFRISGARPGSSLRP